MRWFWGVALIALTCANIYFYSLHPGDRVPTYSGIRVLFLCAGQKDEPHIIPFQRGLERAEKDFGCDIKIWWVGWEHPGILEDFKKAIDYRPDAICVPGYENADGYEELLEEAFSKGIRVTFYHTPFPELQKKYQPNGVGFVGQNQYGAGRKLAQRAELEFGLSKESEVLVLGNSRKGADLRQRSKGLGDYIRELGAKVEVVDMHKYWFNTPSANMSTALEDYVKDHGMPDCILHDAAGVDMLVQAFDDVGIPPGRIQVGFFDSSKFGVDALKRNYAQLLLRHDASQQSYLSVLQACLAVKFKSPGMEIYLPENFIDQENLHEFEGMLLEDSSLKPDTNPS